MEFKTQTLLYSGFKYYKVKCQIRSQNFTSYWRFYKLNKIIESIVIRSVFFLSTQQRVCQSVTCRRSFRTGAKLHQTNSRLTPQEVSSILRASEYTSEDISVHGNGPVKAFDMNSLRSNSPIEDSHNEAVVRPPGAGPQPDPTTLLFGVFDGHGGAACGQVSAIYNGICF